MRRGGLWGVAAAVAALACLVGCGGSGDAGGGGATQRDPVAGSCATLARAGALRMRIAKTDRDALVHIPPAVARQRRTAPLLIMVHGLTEQASDYATLPDLRREIDAAGYAAVFPNGLVNAWSYPGSPSDERYWPQERRFFEQLVDRLAGLDCVDPERIYVAGQSLGGGLATELTCVMSKQVAGFALAAALHLTSPCPHAPAVPVISFHALDDPAVPYDGRKADGPVPEMKAIDDVVAASARRNGCAPRPRTTPVADGIERTFRDCHAPVVHVRLTHGVHALIGSPYTTRVARRMLRFFAAQRGSG